MKSALTFAAFGLVFAANVATAQDAGLESPEWKQLLKKARPVARAQDQIATPSKAAPADRYEYLYKYSPY